MSAEPIPVPKSRFSFGEWALAASVSLLTALAVVSPFFFLGTASGHDIAFHMASWLDAAGQWKQGILFPRWAEWANFGYGEPRFVFYPPLSWLLGALLGTIVPWNAVAAVFFVGVETLAGVAMYALLGRCVASRWGALLGAACFTANPYALLIVYARSDFAELLAMAFYPLVFLAVFRICGYLPERTGGLADVLGLAVPFSAVWLANAPAAVIATYGTGFLLVLAAIERRSFGPVWSGGAGMLLGFALGSFYLIPAIYEQRWVQIAGALAGGLTPAENFLYARTADAEHDAFNRVASNMAVVLLAWVAVMAVAVYRASRQRPDRLARGMVFSLGALAAAVLVLELPVSSLAWSYLPELRFVQFPWRFMSLLAVLAAIYTAATARGRGNWILLLGAALLTVGCGRYLVKHTWWDTEDMPTLRAAVAAGEGYEGTDEYDPQGDDRTDLPEKRLRAWPVSRATHAEEKKDVQIFTDVWTAEERLLRVKAASPALVAIRLLDYPAWRATVDGRSVAIRRAPKTAQMMLEVPAGESRIELRFMRTWDRTIGGWISALSALGALYLLAARRRREARAAAGG
jgi:6-pyruvoyl-tetrahydropterin synthase related domain